MGAPGPTLFFFFLFFHSLKLGLIQHQGHKEDVLAIVEGSQNSIGCGHHARAEQRLKTVQDNSLLTVTQLKNRSVYYNDYNRTRITLSPSHMDLTHANNHKLPRNGRKSAAVLSHHYHPFIYTTCQVKDYKVSTIKPHCLLMEKMDFRTMVEL